ncbi:MAG TPA: UvrD-helicase domain-containing protein [Streptosporangiaceae bacterium]|nr:UvrD-helicase domain-containing protein [Streptosporangiaceae bacterium]
MITGEIHPTGQQQAVIDACVSGAGLVIEAGAGTGKTSTLRMAAAAMPGRSGLYVAYNRVTAESARRIFPSEVRCVTAHALAFSAVGRQFERRLPPRGRRMPAWAVASMLGIGEPLRLGSSLLLTPAHQARIAMGTVERFCYSADMFLSARHVPPVNGIDAASFAELTWRIIPYAERAWRDLTLPDGRLPFRHDHYLKIWQLTRPRIAAGYIMFDEAQDANPVTAAIIQAQHEVQQIAVGDSCQAIYGWRGAVDALATWPAEQRLQLSHSFRFGPAVAAEANKWLRRLGAQFQLSGTPRIDSVVGTVAQPHAILCRTNAEALQQARWALDAGRRVRLAGDGGDIRQLARAALELQATGHTSNPELAAFRSWHAVQQFVHTDAAGADLAANVRLIDKWGATAVLNLVTQLSRVERAELTVSTAHRAKGLEWGRVLVASDFSDRRSSRSPPRAEAMLAYVAVTRARHELDTSGLPDARATTSSTDRKEIAMNTTRTDTNDLATSDGKPFEARPYQGGRAQAESGSRIIENDFDAWTVAFTQPDATMTAEHPRVVQLNQAWRAVSRHGLGDDPGAAGVRYRILAHAAASLAETATENGQEIEAKALSHLADHAGKHAARLRATADDMYLRSRLSGPYEGGRAQASAGSRIIDMDYRAWADTAAASQAATDPRTSEPARRVRHAWEEASRRGLADGPGPAAERYQLIADAAGALAAALPVELPSSGLGELLQLAGHARKHAIRLGATGNAQAAASSGESVRSEPYRDLPADVAAVAAQAHTGQEPVNGHRDGKQHASEHDVRTFRQKGAARERD